MNIYDRILELLETGDDECTILGAVIWKNHSTLKELRADNGNHYVWDREDALRRNHVYVYMDGAIPGSFYQTLNWGMTWIEDPSRTITLVYNPYLDAITNYSGTTGPGYQGVYNSWNSVVGQFSGAVIPTVF